MQIGYHVGALIKPSKQFAIGLRYLSRQESEVDDGTIRHDADPDNRFLPAFLPPPLGGASIDAPGCVAVHGGPPAGPERESPWRVRERRL